MRLQLDNVTYDDVTEHCVPNDANYVGAFNMGIPQGGASLPLDSWVWKPFPMEAPDLNFGRLVTSDCAPALAILKGVDGDIQVLQTDYYFDIQTTIKDPTVFNLPDYCKFNAQEYRLSASESAGFFLNNKARKFLKFLKL
jgi:hypothetical protein